MNYMPGNLAYRTYKLFWEALDWLYPPNCGGCGQPGTRWCKVCASNTTEIEPPICPICGNPNSSREPCQRCQAHRPYFTALRSYTVYRGCIRQAVHRLKYRRDIGLGEILARPMIECLLQLNWSLDIITSVPLGLARFQERGYNQATLLARPIALSLRLPFSSHILSRTRETLSQVGLTLGERQENMANAFNADCDAIRGKNILVVDDVATSGATLNACAKAMMSGGADNVYCFSLARAVFTPDNDIDLT